MSNLKWLNDLVAESSQDIMDLADDLWDEVLQGSSSVPESVRKGADAVGKFPIVATLGVMTYMPGEAKHVAELFGKAASSTTGVSPHLGKGGYLGNVSEGLAFSASLLKKWGESEEGGPNLTSSKSVEDIRKVFPFFRGGFLKQAAEARKKKMEATQQEVAGGSLLIAEEDVNG